MTLQQIQQSNIRSRVETHGWLHWWTSRDPWHMRIWKLGHYPERYSTGASRNPPVFPWLLDSHWSLEGNEGAD